MEEFNVKLCNKIQGITDDFIAKEKHMISFKES